ncbi:MAG: glyoxalase [Frankiales bacterium]|nr:glyoxalase [Frankiales bacterium]
MTLSIESVSVDSTDPARIAPFWAAALGWPISDDSDDDEVILVAPAGTTAPELLFLRVPEDKAVKNRLHLDLRPSGDQEAEVARLETLGARRVDIGQSDDVSWIVMADHDGNEFCVLSVKKVAADLGVVVAPR